MFDHVGFDVRDLKKSNEFYRKALAPLGIQLLVELPEYRVAGFGTSRPQFWVAENRTATPPEDLHVAFAAESRAKVDEFYRAALAAGGKDNGPPGPRPEYHEHYYGAFVLDPDGVNIEACCHKPAGA